jgi:hypothetical protein
LEIFQGKRTPASRQLIQVEMQPPALCAVLPGAHAQMPKAHATGCSAGGVAKPLSVRHSVRVTRLVILYES